MAKKLSNYRKQAKNVRRVDCFSLSNQIRSKKNLSFRRAAEDEYTGDQNEQTIYLRYAFFKGLSDAALASDITYGDFFRQAPAYNPASDLIKGKVCGVQVETIEDPLMKRVRQLDNLVDDLAKGKPLEKVLR